MYITSIGYNSYAIIDSELNMDEVNFKQINFKVVDNILITLWFYLSRHNKDIVCKVKKYFIEFSKIKDVNTIEIRNVAQDKNLMKKLLDKFEF
ncbi:hypothetical protein FDF69_06360 [Clostridium sporogenes]|uniref:hypothetical protein n=1 Tax=Clostridium sporogenes TaxID=1509 RepID=UPI0013D74882|nr:hypothetical protein [Clostridium sporogenes]NFF65906.1 hypothetical protein [Clostridium sporogenes]NFF98295.1 hypothetical protein [Clostridium sporogenes]NFG05373.1 hypothetical protein [Clostridium sporogenes]NFG50956.1 hypothetical protein [Clostridium sporogenes]NFP83212.1 hypothetical protein [Clostridium sporogenes]